MQGVTSFDQRRDDEQTTENGEAKQ